MKFSKLLLSAVALCVAGVILLILFNKPFVYWEFTKIKDNPKAYLNYAYWSVENDSDIKSDAVISYLVQHKEEAIKELKENWDWNKFVYSKQSQIQNAILIYMAETDYQDLELKFNNSKEVTTIEQLLKNLNSKTIIGNKEYGPYIFQDSNETLIDKVINKVGGWEVTIDKWGGVNVKYGSKNQIIRKNN